MMLWSGGLREYLGYPCHRQAQVHRYPGRLVAELLGQDPPALFFPAMQLCRSSAFLPSGKNICRLGVEILAENAIRPFVLE